MFEGDLLGDGLRVNLPTDEQGYTGRECPDPDCLGYFKVMFGTGIKGEGPCHCPYCGHTDGHDKFFTTDQIEYLQSIAANAVGKILFKQLKKLESHNRPQRGFINLTWKVTEEPHPIYHYQEGQLETDVICDVCTLRYAIYGVFAFCPDCGTHNSLQILQKNLEVVD